MYIKKILWTIAILGLIVFGVVAYYIYGAMFKANTKFNSDIAYVYIPTNSNYSLVRKKLEPLLLDLDKFDALARQKKYTTNIKSGKFAIKKGMNNNEIINSIRSNNLPIKVAFNNQNTLANLAGRISKQIEADSTTLIASMTNSGFLLKNGFTEKTALAMYLPNSYEFFWNTSANAFTDRMLKEYQRFWTNEKINKAKQINLTPNQVITFASIVYEESKQPKEQPIVAGLYLNRLNIGMPLQADPTLKYAAYQLAKYKNSVIRRVLNVHKEIVSPYNTYLNKGLPPGPIAMPDLSAINAVLNYTKHNYLYMVADVKRIGFHKFAKSLSEHNANAREYQRYLNNKGINK